MIAARWRIKCNVDCPYCDNLIDLMTEIEDSYEWLPKAGHCEEIEVEVICPKCNREFIVQKTEY
ncbi:hypothetical protein GCM10023149_48830 [Mucilaginibacter gynuensis]|uniref:Uncharacterized protein n=1 Tax=Mucilaginibacter gynuensis TaxID=1302236 RepID=A0ABP8HFK2_9SPHI